MENNGDRSGEEAPMYSDTYLFPILQELHKADNLIYYPRRSLALASDIIKRATGTIEQLSQDTLLEGRKGTYDLQNLVYRIVRINTKKINVTDIFGRLSSQMTREILNGNDTHSITLNVLNQLSNIGWRDKLPITLVAFAVTFCDFWLLVRIYADNAVNEHKTTDQTELTSTNKEAYRNQIEANNEFIKNLVKPLRYLIDVGKLKFPIVDMRDDQVQIYVYWAVRCVIVAATQIILLSSRGLDQYLVGIRTPTEVEKLKSINEDLMRIISEGKKRRRAQETLGTKLTNIGDIMGFMKVIITDNGMPPLYHAETKKMDDLDVLSGKRVLLLMSKMDILFEDIRSLKRVIIDTKKDEIVWIPIINRSTTELDSVKNQIETLQNSMSWYSVHPSIVTDDAIYYFGMAWNSKYCPRPILMLLSPSGGIILKLDAFRMVRIWQNLFLDNLTLDMERQLWEKETWNVNLLINDIIIDPILQKWIRDESYIILYGGKDIDWIRRFTRQAHSVASDLQTCIKMVYLGDGLSKDRGCGVRNEILAEQLSHCLPESSMVYFWTRLDSMIESRTMIESRFGFEPDDLSRQLSTVRNYDEWVLLARGSTILVNGPGQLASDALEIWEDHRDFSYIRNFTFDC